MEYVYKKARAKINLTLNVLERRDDGYHNIESVFQKISLYDEIIVTKKYDRDDIKIISNVKLLESKDNIIYKAYSLLKSRFSNITGIEVSLKKNIPMQAGLAGGSTDCASFLECMNELFLLNLTSKQMQDIGVKLGADVPSCFYKYPIIARGIGDIIEQVDGELKYYLVIIKPKFSCNTKAMYERLDSAGDIKQKYNTEVIRNAIKNKNVENVAENLYNVFEISINDISHFKEELLNAGALGALMTGSGSCVYGIFKDKHCAKHAYLNLKQKYETYFCVTK